MQVFLCLIGVFRQLPFFILLVRFSLFSVTLGIYLIGKNRLLTQKILLTSLMASTLYFVMNNLFHTSGNDLQASFIIGNIYQVVEVIFIFSFKNLQERYIMCIMFALLKSCIIKYDLPLIGRIAISSTGPLFTLIYITYFNIQDRKVFQALSNSWTKLQAILSNDFPHSAVIVDLRVEKLLYSNKSFESNFETSAQDSHVDVLQRFVIDKNSLEDHQMSPSKNEEISLDNFIKQISGEFSGDDKTYNVNTSFLDMQQGSKKRGDYEVKVHKMLWNGEESYAIIFTDPNNKETITALKLADEQKDRVIANLAHEFRTPINGILGLIELTMPLVHNSQAQGYLDSCKSCGKLLLHQVNSILNLSQMKNNKLSIIKEYVYLDTLIEEIRSLYIYTSRQKGIEFIIEKGSKVPDNIYTDQYKLMGILINLLTNSIKFTFKGSVTLRISLDCQIPNRAIFSVEDTGIGIRENDKSKLFKTFGKLNQQNKSINTQGVGLGLTIASNLVKALTPDEKIEFESQYGKGTRFWFRIDISSPEDITLQEQEMSGLLKSFERREYSVDCPGTPDKKIMKYFSESPLRNMTDMMMASPLSGRSSTLASVKNQGRNVLLVDDVPMNLVAASFMLEKLGYTVIKAYNGQEGIELLKKSKSCDSSKFEFVITDMQMPVMDGLAMTRKIKRMIEKGEIYKIPVLCFTANDVPEEDLAVYKNNGICSVLKKPLEQEELLRVINKVL